MRPVRFSVLFLSVAGSLFGWSTEGHRVVALITQSILQTSPAAVNLGHLLGSLSLAGISTCPDEVRELEGHQITALSPACAVVFPAPPLHTGPWHFVNIPVTGSSPTAAIIRTACGTDCVLVQIDRFAAVLQQSNDQQARLQALSFLVHFVGDLHQPLHNADRMRDAGGNAEVVTFQGQPLKLHGLWDRQIVTALNADPALLAQDLAPEIQAAKKESPGSPVMWASQAFQFAANQAYRGIPPPNGTTPVAVIGPKYEKAALPVIRKQLARAGVRLAAVLQTALHAPASLDGQPPQSGSGPPISQPGASPLR